MAFCASHVSFGMEPDRAASLAYELRAIKLFCASAAGDLERVEQLIDDGVSPKGYGEALLEAARRKKFEICKALLDAGADVNATNEYGLTPLIYASSQISLEVSELLLQYGADHELRDHHARSAIDYARVRLVHFPESSKKLGEIIALLEDSERIHAVIVREDNPNLKKLRKSGQNIFNALMNRELGGK